MPESYTWISRNDGRIEKSPFKALATLGRTLYLWRPEKRRIITVLFPNLEMSAEKLVFKPRKPFDVFLNLPHRPNWLPGHDSNM